MMRQVPSIMCRLCGGCKETIVHLLAACPVLAATEYLYCHNLVVGVIHWHLLRVYGLPLSCSSWFTHKPTPVIETSEMKLLYMGL